MALPTGTISMSQVNVELQKSATATISLNDTLVRQLGNKPSGTISMSDLHGKSYLKNVNVTLFDRSVTDKKTIFNINYNIYKCQMTIKNAGNGNVYCKVDGVYTGEIRPSRTITLDLPQGYGRSVRLNSVNYVPQHVVVKLIGQVYS